MVGKDKYRKYSIEKKCMNCDSNFLASIYNIRKGFGKYCSSRCAAKVTRNGFKKYHPNFVSQEARKIQGLKIKGEKNYLWKGEDAVYSTKHMWVRRWFGKPSECEHCGMNEEKRMYHWANISREYRRDREDWIRLCVSCHKKYDLAR